MTKFLKKNWLILSVCTILAVFIYLKIDSAIATHAYNKKIKAKDATISSLWGKIGDSKKREATAIASSEKNYALAMEQEAKVQKKDAEMRVKLAEKRALKKIIREMPVTQVIVRTIEIINCPDVVRQEQGVVFTLDCARQNLVVLENVFYFKKEALDWADQFFTSQNEVVNLKDALRNFDKAYKERGVQLTSAYGVIDEWEGKFDLSEKRGKAKWWKGLKTGGLIGGIVGFLAGFVLAK